MQCPRKIAGGSAVRSALVAVFALAAAAAWSADLNRRPSSRPRLEPARQAALQIEPAAFTIVGPYNVQRLLVLNGVADASVDDRGERLLDVSRRAVCRSSDPGVAVVSGDGVVRPTGDGAAEISATFGGATVAARVAVQKFADVSPVSFAHLKLFLSANPAWLQLRRLPRQGRRPKRLSAVSVGLFAAVRSCRDRAAFARTAGVLHGPRGKLVAAQGNRRVHRIGSGSRLDRESPAYEAAALLACSRGCRPEPPTNRLWCGSNVGPSPAC